MPQTPYTRSSTNHRDLQSSFSSYLTLHCLRIPLELLLTHHSPASIFTTSDPELEVALGANKHWGMREWRCTEEVILEWKSRQFGMRMLTLPDKNWFLWGKELRDGWKQSDIKVKHVAYQEQSSRIKGWVIHTTLLSGYGNNLGKEHWMLVLFFCSITAIPFGC